MSHYDWERGTITLPAAGWVPFRKELIAGYTKALRQDFLALVNLHERIALSIKGKRGVDIEKVVDEAVFSAAFVPKVLGKYEARDALRKRDEATGKCKLKAPKKQDFPEPKQTHTTFSAGDGEGSITLDNAKRTVTWSVSENNHACEHARETYMGQLLFKLLGQVKWTRGTGGALRGNDEYNRESGEDRAGEGGSYLKDRFGPLGDLEYERVHGIKPPAKPASTRMVGYGMALGSYRRY